MSYLPTLEQLFLSLTQNNSLTYNELTIVLKQSGLNDMMINQIVQDIIKQTHNVSYTNKFNCDQFIYGMLLIYRNMSNMDINIVNNDLQIMLTRLNDSTLSDLETQLKKQLSLPKSRSQPIQKIEVVPDTTDIYVSSHRRKVFHKSKSFTSNKELSLKQYSLLKQVSLLLSSSTNTRAMSINMTNHPFHSHSQNISQILDFLFYFQFNTIYKISSSISSTSISQYDDKILLLNQQLFLIKDAKRNNYSYSQAWNKLNATSSNASSSPISSTPNASSSKEERAKILLQQRMKSLGINQNTPVEDPSVEQGLSRCYNAFPSNKSDLQVNPISPVNTILQRIQYLSSSSHVPNVPNVPSNPYQSYSSTYFASDHELNQSSINSHFTDLSNSLKAWDPNTLNTSKSNLLALGINQEWLDSPFVKQDQPNHDYEAKIKKLDVFHNISPTKQQTVPASTSTKSEPVLKSPIAVKQQEIKQNNEILPNEISPAPLTDPVKQPIVKQPTVDPVSSSPASVTKPATTKSARKPPPPPPSRSTTTPSTPSNPFQFSNMQSQLQSKLQFQSSPPVYNLPKPTNKRISISSASSTTPVRSPIQQNTTVPPPPPAAPTPPSESISTIPPSLSAPRIDLLAQIRNHSNTSSNEDINEQPPPRTTSIPSSKPPSNPLLDQMKQSMSNRRTQLGETSSDDGSDNWSKSTGSPVHTQPPQYSPEPQIQQIQEQESEPEDIFQDVQEPQIKSPKTSQIAASPVSAVIPTQYTALYDFNGQQPGDLPFLVGDIIQSTNPNSDNGWTDGTNLRTQEQGQFPISYTQLEKQPPTEYAIALYQFNAVQPNDLSLLVDQQIRILEYDDSSEWLQACTIPPTQSGMVPRNYIKMIDVDDLRMPVPPIINSIISEYRITEHTYVSDMGVLVTLHNELTENKMITSKECHMLFRNVVDIHTMNQHMLNALESIDMNSKQLMKDFASVLSAYIPSKYTIYNEYCSNQYSSQLTLQHLINSNTKFNSHISTYMKQPHCRNIALNAFMLLPMQRITRINLLLKQLVKHSDSVLFNETSSEMEQLLSTINKNAMEWESTTRINELIKILDLSELDGFDLLGNTKLQSKRVLVHDGILIKNKSGRVLHGWLFNDLLLLGEKKEIPNKYMYKTYKRPLPFTELINVVRIQDTSDIIRLETYEQVVLLRATDKSSHKLWINKIQMAIKEFNEQIKKTFENERLLSMEISHDKNKSKLDKMMGNIEEVYVGTINVTIDYGQHFPNLDLKKYFVLVQVGKQRLKTKVVKRVSGNGKIQINQTLMFSLRSLDDVLKVYLYNMTKYGEDVMVGLHEMPLNYLEYYNDNAETELMMVSVGKEALLGIKLRYKRV